MRSTEDKSRWVGVCTVCVCMCVGGLTRTDLKALLSDANHTLSSTINRLICTFSFNSVSEIF